MFMIDECKLFKMLSACDYNNIYMNCAMITLSVRMLYCDIVPVGPGHIKSLQYMEDNTHGICQRGTIDASETVQVVKCDPGVL